MPPGLTLGADGSLTGTPTKASSTPFAFTVTVTDSSKPTPATNSVPYAITISEPPPPSIINTPPPTATVGSLYSFPFTASDGLAPLLWTASSAPMGGLAVSLDGILSGTPSTAGIFPITLTVKDALNQSSPATPFTVRVAMARPAAAFVQTGRMTVARAAHTATLLLDGRVLIAGGGSASAELYDPTSQTFTATGSMTLAQDARSATLLANSKLPNYGKVLMAGGDDVIAELYDPKAGTFTATGSTGAQHLGQTATLLQNGHVLIAGGETAKAELFNPSTGAFTATGSMTISRTGHTATLLPDGRVLIAGGVQDFGPGTVPIPLGPGVASAELYDPVSGTFSSTGSMSEGRSGIQRRCWSTVPSWSPERTTRPSYSAPRPEPSQWLVSRQRDSEPRRHCVTTARSSSRAALIECRSPRRSFSLPRVGASWRRVRSSRHGTDIRRRGWSMAPCSLRAELVTCAGATLGALVPAPTPCFRRLNCSSSVPAAVPIPMARHDRRGRESFCCSAP